MRIQHLHTTINRGHNPPRNRIGHQINQLAMRCIKIAPPHHPRCTPPPRAFSIFRIFIYIQAKDSHHPFISWRTINSCSSRDRYDYAYACNKCVRAVDWLHIVIRMVSICLVSERTCVDAYLCNAPCSNVTSLAHRQYMQLFLAPHRRAHITRNHFWSANP